MSQPRFTPADFALLGAPAGADEAAVRKAFLQAVKAARPDQGGDPEHYREVIAAWSRLNARPAGEANAFRSTGSSVLFNDFHAEWFRPDQLSGRTQGICFPPPHQWK